MRHETLGTHNAERIRLGRKDFDEIIIGTDDESQTIAKELVENLNKLTLSNSVILPRFLKSRGEYVTCHKSITNGRLAFIVYEFNRQTETRFVRNGKATYEFTSETQKEMCVSRIYIQKD